MASTGEWVLRRVGILEPEFTLQDHVSQVSLGRGEGNSKQCLSVFVSRQHALLNKVMGEDGLPYWKLKHISKTTFTYVNGNELKLNSEIRLNDRDLISLGENFSPEQCQGHKNRFLFRILAPTYWNSNPGEDEEDANPIEATQSILESDTPPRVKSPVLKIEPGYIIHSESRKNDPAASSNEVRKILDFQTTKEDTKPILQFNKTSFEYASKPDDTHCPFKSQSMPNIKVEKQYLFQKGTVENPANERNMDEEMAFSQVEEVIVLDESDESDFLSNTFSKDYPDEQVNVKAEPYLEEENHDHGEDDDDIQIIFPGPEKEQITVIDLDDTELELDESQKNLFHRIAHKIKREQDSPVKKEPVESPKEILNDDSDDEIIFLGETENPFESFAALTEKTYNMEKGETTSDHEKESLSNVAEEAPRSNHEKEAEMHHEKEPEMDHEKEIQSATKSTDLSEALSDRISEDLITPKSIQENKNTSSTGSEALKSSFSPHRPPMLIDPLPQVKKRGMKRSISKEHQKESSVDPSPAKQPLLSSRKEIKLKRHDKLKQIAVKESSNKKPGPKSSKSKSAVKVYSTLPKLGKSGLVNSSLEEIASNSSSNLKTISHHSEPSTNFSSSSSSPDENAVPVNDSGNGSFKVPHAPSLAKKPRLHAETVADKDGLKRIAKLKFNNVISNTSSQDISNLGVVVAPKVLSYPSISDKSTKRLKWKSQLTTIKEIPREGKGLKVNRNKDCPSSLRTSKAPPAKILLKNEFTIDKIIAHILSWNTSWLEEQTRVSVSPRVDLNRFKMTHVPPVFDNYEDYCNIFFPLMFHELWQTVYRDYLQRKDRPIRQVAEIFDVKPYKEGQISSFCARSLLTAQDKSAFHFIPRGTLIKINLFTNSGTKSIVRPCFGFVTDNRLIPRNGSSKLCDNLLKTYPGPLRDQLTFINEYSVIALSLVISQMSISPRTKFPVIELVSYINPSLRLFGAVIEARKSPLFPCLLKHEDSSSVPTVTGPQDVGPLPHLNKLNPIQRKIVMDISETCALASSSSPFLSLIQGPPGTGKSTVISSLVIQIISRFCINGHVPPKILISAPSNSAVDELVKKIQKADGGSQLKMVRVGQLNSMDKQVKSLELTQLVSQQLQEIESRLGNNKSIKLEIAHRQEEINHIGLEIEKEVSTNPASSKINLLQRQLKDQQGKLLRAKRNIKNVLSSHEKERKKHEITKRILDDYDIVAATLSSSLNGQMMNHFLRPESKPKRGISICIVDEASQCVEPEGLIPLRLGFSKLIMVGDPEQLPATVSSVKAKDLSYGQSLFNRLFKSSRNNTTSASIHRLKIQYRMHGEIARWPNHYFYGGDLTNGVSWASRNSNIYPLKLFDLSWTRMEVTPVEKSIFNTKEAKFVATLVKELKKEHSELPGNKSIGVITFYSQQRKHLSLELQNLGIETSDGKKSSKAAVIVSTVDGFQGSECDVIVISCVRSCNNSGNSSSSIGFIAESERLNVALTRAKYALYVVGDFQSISKSLMWSDLLKDVRKRKCIVSIDEDYDIKTLRSHFLKA